MLICTRIQWGSENRPFENRNHSKTGHFEVGFRMVGFQMVGFQMVVFQMVGFQMVGTIAKAIVPTIFFFFYKKTSNFTEWMLSLWVRF